MEKKLVTERKLGNGTATRIWKVEPGVMLTSMEIHHDGEKLERVRPTPVGFFNSEEEIIEFVTHSGDELVSLEEVE